MAEALATMTIQAHAKINIVLKILGLRADGYHEIETLMVPILLADELEVEVSEGEGIRLTCDDPSVPADSQNLVWRAVEAFSRATDRTFQTRIVLRKSIPSGAGLGGGSSDAAAVIRTLDILLGTGLGESRLEEIAAVIGSDVPFFIRSRPTWCRGRGEIMDDAGGFPPTRLLLVKPPFPVSTAWAYSQKMGNAGKRPQRHGDKGTKVAGEAASGSAGVPPASPECWQDARPPGNLQRSEMRPGDIELVNDLEAPVFRKFLLLPVIKSWLREQPEVSAAMMSGSGSTIFAVLKGPGTPVEVRARARFGESLWTHECRTL